MVQKAHVLRVLHRRAAKYQTCSGDGACTNGQGQRDRFVQSLLFAADLKKNDDHFWGRRIRRTENSPCLILHQRDAAPAPRAVRDGGDHRQPPELQEHSA